MQATEQEIKLHEISMSYALIYRGRDIVFVKVREMGKTRSVVIHIFNSISVDGRLLFPVVTRKHGYVPLIIPSLVE